jgi:hypothetical protein
MKIGSINVDGKSFDVWMNPKRGEFAQIGETLRFTADLTTHTLYVWDFSAGHHTDVSVGMGLGDAAYSTLFLKGAATKTGDETYVMSGSDFLQSFVGRMTEAERLFLSKLLDQDWEWVDRYIEVTEWLHRCRGRLGV